MSQFLKLSFYFLTTIILARLLQPDDFGLLGMAMVFTSLVTVFNDFGLGSAVIQKIELHQKALSSVFWASVGIGVLTMGVTILAAPWIAAFYRQEKLQALLYFLSVSFLLTSLGQVQSALLIKQLNFKKVAIIEIASGLLGSLVAVGMAVLNYGVWSLVAQVIATSGIATLLLWITTQWRPGLNFEVVSLQGVLNYSGGLFGFNLLNYFSRNADYLLIGKFLGAGPLGLYTFAYRLMQFPMQSVTAVVNRVLFPILTQVKDNDEQLRRGFIQASQWVAMVTFPIMVFVLVLAPELILVVFGARWQSAIPVIQILALVGLTQSVIGMVGNIYTAKDKTDWLFYWGIVSSSIAVSGIVIGLRWGIVGVAIGYACATLILAYPNFAIPFHLIGLRFVDYVSSMKLQILLAMLLGLIIFISASLQRLIGMNQVVILISNLLLGGAAYLVMVVRFDSHTLIDLIHAALGKQSVRILDLLNLHDGRNPITLGADNE